jgi:hypothetical protein
MKHAPKLFVATGITYLVVAACASKPTLQDDGGLDAKAIIDAVSDPVTEAQADPANWTVTQAPCSKDDGKGNKYAELNVPGKLVRDLAPSTAIVHHVSATALPGYQFVRGTSLVTAGTELFFRDDFVAAFCGPGDYVLFVVPK